MTLIAGYIYKNHVHILADSAETISIPGIQPIKFPEEYSSSFKESPHADVSNGKLIIESAQKIYNLRNKILVTFSGMVKEGDEIVHLINLHLLNPNFQPGPNSIISLIKKEKPENTEYIIGGVENGMPYLIGYYSEKNCPVFTENYSGCIGSKGASLSFDHLFNFGLHFIKTYNKHQHSPEESLIYMLSVLQTYSINRQIVQQQVGGYFNGALISENGVEWAKDTCHILYSTSNFDCGEKLIANRFNRENAVFMLSSSTNRCFVIDWFKAETKKYIEKYKSELEELSTKYQVDYFVFISYDAPTVVIVSNKKGGGNLIKPIGNGKFQIPRHIFAQMLYNFKNIGTATPNFDVFSHF